MVVRAVVGPLEPAEVTELEEHAKIRGLLLPSRILVAAVRLRRLPGRERAEIPEQAHFNVNVMMKIHPAAPLVMPRHVE